MVVDIGTFAKDVDHATCNLFAQRAMQLNFINVDWNLSDPYTTFGTGNAGGPYESVVIIVACIPQSDGSTWVEVFASSDDGGQAEDARNAVRTQIMQATIFDPPPRHPTRVLKYGAVTAHSRALVPRSAERVPGAPAKSSRFVPRTIPRVT
jgi:hypothetical protein